MLGCTSIGIVKAENDNIGLGLSCSREISRKLGGDMKLKRSKKGLTSFVFKFPVGLKDDKDQPIIDLETH